MGDFSIRDRIGSVFSTQDKHGDVSTSSSAQLRRRGQEPVLTSDSESDLTPDDDD
jgi:hypothetical protein